MFDRPLLLPRSVLVQARPLTVVGLTSLSVSLSLSLSLSQSKLDLKFGGASPRNKQPSELGDAEVGSRTVETLEVQFRPCFSFRREERSREHPPRAGNREHTRCNVES